MKRIRYFQIAAAVLAVLSIGVVAAFTMAGPPPPEVIIVLPTGTVASGEAVTVRAIYIGGRIPANAMISMHVTPGNMGNIPTSSIEQVGNAVIGIWGTKGSGNADLTVRVGHANATVSIVVE